MSNIMAILSSFAPEVQAALIGSLASIIGFFLSNIWWQSRIDKKRERREIIVNRLNNVYAPLYVFYREHLSAFDAFRKKYPDSVEARHPMVSKDIEIPLVSNIIRTHANLIDPAHLEKWTKYKHQGGKSDDSTVLQMSFVKCIVMEYQSLRKSLQYDYDKSELETGELKIIL